MITLHTHDREIVAEKAGKRLTEMLRGRKETLLLISGGSAFSVLDYVDSKVLTPELTIAMLDERYSNDEQVNNYLQFTRTALYGKAIDAGVNIFTTSIIDSETKEEMASRYNTFLSEWMQENKKGNIAVVFGIGADGHTAGIAPHLPSQLFSSLFESNEFVIAYETEYLEPSERITTTATFFKYVTHGICYAVGEDKREAIGHVMEGGGLISEVPARVLHRVPHLHLFTDQKV
ncbi:MAG: 6-phosphogluconolactonase [Candidatus Paceibacterota bacterium]